MTTQVRHVPAKTDPAIPGPPRGTIRIDVTSLKRRLVTCEPGVINEELNRHTGKHGLVFGPDLSSHSRCVISGNIGNNSCGIHSVQSQLYGPVPRTSDNVHALEIVTYDGARKAARAAARQ